MPMLRLWKVLGTIKPIGQSACQSLVNCQCVPIHPIPIFPFSMQLSHNRKYRSLWNMPQSFCQNHTIPTLLCKAWHPSHAAGLVEPIHKHRKNATRFFLGTQQGGCEYKNHAPRVKESLQAVCYPLHGSQALSKTVSLIKDPKLKHSFHTWVSQMFFKFPTKIEVWWTCGTLNDQANTRVYPRIIQYAFQFSKDNHWVCLEWWFCFGNNLSMIHSSQKKTRHFGKQQWSFDESDCIPGRIRW